jgi:hypothetical protein
VPLLTNDSKQIIGINTGSYPQTPQSRIGPPAFGSSINNKQLPQSSFSNGITPSLSQSSSINNRSAYSNNNINNNNNIIQNNNNNSNTNVAINNYQPKPLNLMPPAPPRANLNNNISSNSNSSSSYNNSSSNNNNVFQRPDIKPFSNGRSTAPQLSKHEVNITFYFYLNAIFYFIYIQTSIFPIALHILLFFPLQFIHI